MNGSPVEPIYALAAVILAAGRSQRMGRPKMLLPWGDSSVLGHVVGQWNSIKASQVFVVWAMGDQSLRTELDRLGFPEANRICNPAPGRGMFSSIQCAARWAGWNPGLTHWGIVLGDQPLVRHETLQQLLVFSAAHPAQICQPVSDGHGRHPVLLPRPGFLSLGRSQAPTLKAFLQARAAEVAGCPADDPGLEVDLDRPEDYARALELARKQELNRRTIPANNEGTKYESR
jgi:molybdenum cofactor cytidylyltransferase